MSENQGRPLWKKLGLKPGSQVLIIDAPDQYYNWLEAPFEIQQGEVPFDFIHAFIDRKLAMEELFSEVLTLMKQDGMLWISWPKKSSKVESDITDAAIRDMARPLGLIDVKVVSVSATWSSLKFVIRKEHRKQQKV